MKIILVFKTHFDIGFTDLASNVIDQYAGSMLEQVIETCKGTQKLGKRHFVWTMPAWPLWHIVNHSEPKLRKELDELIENGQVVWHAFRLLRIPILRHRENICVDSHTADCWQNAITNHARSQRK